MRIDTTTTEFKRAIELVGRFAPKKHPLPVLACMQLIADEQGVTLRGADMEGFYSHYVSGSRLVEQGSALINHKTLADVVKRLPKHKPLTIHGENSERVFLDCDGTSLPIPCENLDNYPAWPKAESHGASCEIDSAALHAVLTRASFFLSKDNNRPQLTGVYMELDTSADLLTITATDRHRLSNEAIKVTNADDFRKPEDREVSPCTIVPGHLMKKLARNLAKDKDSVLINFESLHVHFIGGDFHLSARIIEGKYPNYHAVIPTERRFHVDIERVSLAAAVDRLLPLSNEISRQGTMKLNGRCFLQTADIEQDIPETSAEFLGEFSVTNGRGPGRDKFLSVGYNMAYIGDQLKALKEFDELSWEFHTSAGAAVIVPKQLPEYTERLLTLQMPVRPEDNRSYPRNRRKVRGAKLDSERIERRALDPSRLP